MGALEIYAQGCRAWPEIQLPAAGFVALMHNRMPAAGDDAERIDAGEVVLAAACALGDKVALKIFELEYVAPLRRYAASRLAGSDAEVDDVLQHARLALLVAPDGSSDIPLLRYAGRGRLRGLVRTVVQRACAKVRRKSTAANADDDLFAITAVVDAALEDPTADSGPPREATRQAVATAWSEMDADARLLLQLHHLKGIPVDPERADASRLGFESRLSLSFMRVATSTAIVP
ncbi:MAG: hypothetical protein KUG77_00670 [Nannocystaceae bacterium]|nr:hypothetical protein [Nannocystaceae bacterium]